MRRVIIESPYGSDDPKVVQQNVGYARRCLADSLARGEAPIASHLLYTQPGVLDDDVPAEREWGINAGLAWGAVADATVIYLDRGISRGMRCGVSRARTEGRTIELRALDGAHIEAGELFG